MVFIQKQDGKIWAGCQHGYLHTYDPVTGEIVTIHPTEFQGSTIWCMQKDNEGNIWFGLNNGIRLRNGISRQINSFHIMTV